jgi:putative peptidoglycan lipid II flippase
LFGEGVLSASFIPVYARLLAEGKEEEADRVAGAIASILALLVSTLVCLGVVAPSAILGFTALGFEAEKREATIHLVRLLFPGAGLLVMSAWCLGVLNSHRRFLLPYAAGVMWNAGIIAALVAFGGRAEGYALAEVTAYGSVAGSLAQVAVQIPSTLGLLGRFRPGLMLGSEHVRTVLRNFVPVFIGRGVVQISAYADQIIASFLPEGAVTALTHAQVLSMLPVSLFGMSISAAELPAMSSTLGDEAAIASALKERLDRGLRRIALFVVPSAMAFLALGDLLAGALLQSGRFDREDSAYVWSILAGSAVGLLASTLGRLYSSTYYALRDTRTPLNFAIVRVSLTTVLGYLAAVPLPLLLGLSPKWGAAGLTASAGVAGWIEFALLRARLNRRIGKTGLPLAYVGRLWAAAAVGAGLAWAAKLALPELHPIALAALALGPYGAAYFGLLTLFGVDEAKAVLRRVLRPLGIRIA